MEQNETCVNLAQKKWIIKLFAFVLNSNTKKLFSRRRKENEKIAHFHKNGGNDMVAMSSFFSCYYPEKDHFNGWYYNGQRYNSININYARKWMRQRRHDIELNQNQNHNKYKIVRRKIKESQQNEWTDYANKWKKKSQLFFLIEK